MSAIKIKFDANQDYQTKAVDSVVGLFDGLSKEELGNTELSLTELAKNDCVPNVDELFEFESDFIKENFDKIRKANGLKITPSMDSENDGDTLLSNIHRTDYYSYPEFTINMETGTGKTYVYLRTIYKLHEQYGFRKFVVIVPSVAIYEGAISTFNATKSHFETLFPSGTLPSRLLDYDGNVTNCKNFGLSTSIEILLMTVDSFNKATNVIYKPTEKIRGGKLPITYIQETRPILILDEVQNYKTDVARRALRTLHPLFSVGYSATPGKKPTNELYRLTSYEASQMNLVKKIEVLGYQEEHLSVDSPDYFKIINIKDTKTVEVELACMKDGSLVSEIVTLGVKIPFAQKSKNNNYGNLAVENISIVPDNTFVELTDGSRYYQNQANCDSLSKEVVFREMIYSTIKTHIEHQLLLQQGGYDAKVLSLFFIDRVASYKGANAYIARLFDEEFEKLKNQFPAWINLKGEDVREGYFAKKQKPKTTEFEDIDTAIDGKKSEEEKKAEKRAYELIMKGKERLLSSDEKTCFIFAHSALREGWDNPNVFQICALREITSENNRRQTIGRGLRLPVGQNGERIHDNNVNKLTVIANESYGRFVGKLQEEYVADGVMQESQVIPTNKRKTETVRRTARFKSNEFEDIWRKANRKTEYTIHIKTDELIKEAITQLDKITFMPPKLVCTRGKVVITKYELTLKQVQESSAVFNVIVKNNQQHPNLLGELGSTFLLGKGDMVGKKTRDLDTCSELSKLKVIEINYNKNNPEQSSISFNNIEKPLKQGETLTHETTSNRVTTSDVTEVGLPDIPKCNIIERASKEVKITRKTVLAIFKGMKKENREEFMKNPEGFSAQFIATLKEVVANHIAKNIEYEQTDGNINDKDVLFPVAEVYPTTELEDIKMKEKSIYEKIQVDSDVERTFVRRLDESNEKTGDVKLYFKFPPRYKINLPKIIGNYNPDWAIVRRNEQKTQVELIRETKGTEDLNNLWHSNESRKIVCAQKHFQSVGLEYKVVDDKDWAWWKPNTRNYAEEVFGEKKDTDENSLTIV